MMGFLRFPEEKDRFEQGFVHGCLADFGAKVRDRSEKSGRKVVGFP